ncbi:MAG: lysophospholipid acyltransferase family protein [Pirellulaceae bacterium]|nr:lysophospholipid acyltransferase family protein [Pirellulaceae bacterium]
MQRTWFKRVGYCVLQSLTRCLAITTFQVRCWGRENFPRTGGALVCSNHQSFLDPVVIGNSSSRPINYLARKSLFQFGPLGWLLDFVNTIPVEREGFGVGGIRETLRRLKRGEMVLLFPEGTRCNDGHIQPFKQGFSAIARRSRAALVPVGVDGAYDAWPRSERLPQFQQVRVVVGEPISPELVQSLDDEQLLEELRRRIIDCIAQARQQRDD